jgi:hypothetical protein
LWGRVRERGKPQALEFVVPPSPPLPHKGGESRARFAATARVSINEDISFAVRDSGFALTRAPE